MTEGAPAQPSSTPEPRAGQGHRGAVPWRALLGIVLGYALVGVVAGLVWEALWTPPTQVVSQHAVYYVDYASLRRVFSGTLLFTLIGGGASAASALVVTLLTRRRELLVLVAVLLGSTLAGFAMWKTGVTRGPGDPMAIAAHAVNGTRVDGPLELSGRSPFVVWPMVSMLVLSLVFFGWSRDPERPARRHRDDPPADAAATD